MAASDDPRVYFAAERTFLAWIRTGLGLMGVGFAVARFGLFLREWRLAPTTQPGVHGSGFSVYFGVALVTLGVLVNIGSVVHHVATIRALRSDSWVAGRISKGAVALALLLALAGLGTGAYLLLLR